MPELERPPLPIYESRAVAMLMRLLHIDEVDRDAVAAEHKSSRDNENTEKYSFAAFAIVFPTFPIVIRTVTFTEQGPASAGHLQALLLRPSRSKVMQAYLRLAEEVSTTNTTADRPSSIAMHFPCGALRGGLLLHNATLQGSRQFTASIPGGTLGTLTLQPLRDAMVAIREGGWSPASTRNTAGVIVAPFRGAQIDAAIRRGLGRGTSAAILNILAHAAESRAAGEHVRRVEEHQDTIWLHVDQATLAKAVGCEARSVKATIKMLCERGLLQARRGPAGNRYSVTPGWRTLLQADAKIPGGA